MLRALLCRFLSLWLVLGYHQCSWAAVPRNTKLKLGTSVVENASPFPLFSGDRVTFRIALTHTSTSQAKAVDALLQLEIPLYLKVVSYSKGSGIQWSSVDTAEKWTMKFKFNEIMISKSVNLSLVVDVDPHYIANAVASHSVAILVDLWYYGEDGPCSRPPDMYNAMHEFERLSLEIQTTTACEKRIELKSDQYSASSELSKGPAKYASFFQPGVWQTSDAMAREKNQFLQLDLSRLMRVTKIATRGQKTPSIAFVRTYHVYHSKNIIEWFSSRENNDIKVFQANTDGESVVFNPMPSPTIARYLRIVPKSWKKRQVMDVAVFGCQAHPNENLVDYCPIFDFENGVSGWTSTGTAFKNQPTYGDNYKIRTGTSADIQGNSWIATYEDRMRSYTPAGGKQGDAPVGTLTSPSFLIVVSQFRFLIGGTKNNSDVYAELVIDGKSVRKTSGSGDNMTEITWNVKQFSGKEAVLRLVDDTDKGHLNFDAFRVDCFLDADAHDIPLPNRAVMLNPRTHSFYVCDSSHLRSEDSALCRVMSGLSDTWIDIPDIVGLLGVDKSTNQLYAVSKDRYVITSMNPAGGDWRYAKKSDWLKVKPKPSTVRMEAIPWITLRDGVNEETLKTLADSNGDQWRATSLGVGYKPAGQSWVKIAAWRCHVFENAEDPCFSEPCEHQANCTAISRGQYNCSCVPGYTGVNCETDIDECADVFCENGGTCVQGINKYFCRCPYGVDGDHCENLLPACRTSPCLNGGNCLDETPPAFRCDCTSNYKGTLCEIEKEPCLINPCSNGAVCVPTDEGYRCVCQYGYTGTHCTTGIGINLKAVQTQTVTDVNSYLVIKAQIPSHGKSFLENWCKEYERLCKNYDREPTGFGRSYNHIEEYASCQENYFSVMDRANLLGANPNEKVAALAQQVGFTGATPNNSFAFNACDGSKCSSVLPESGCHEGLSCISRSVPNLEVYTVCIDPNSNFRTALKVWGVINGVRQLNLLVTTPSKYSKLTTWCDDYEALCDRYGLRATAERENTGCVEKYRAIFNPSNANGEVRDAVGAGSGFYFRDCAHCNSNSYSTSNAVHYFKYYYNNFGVACMQPNGIGFKVLDDKKLLNYNGKDYTVIKVQVPSNGSSYDKSWCEDYKQLCNSYKMVPLGCGSNCVANYHSSFTTCPISGSEVEQMVRYAGFPSASSSNTFVYKSCEACSHLVNKGECRAGDLFCLDDANPYRVFYTACVKDDEKYLPEDLALRLRDFKLISYQSRPYKVLRLHYLPEDGYPLLSNWCEEYQALCKSVGGRPVGCGPSYSSDPNIANCGTAYGAAMDNDGLGCNNNGIIKDMVKDAGYNPSSYNTFIFHDCSSDSCSKRLTFSCSSWSSPPCSCHPALSCLSTRMSRYSREAYAVCSMASSAFKVLETKDSTYGGHDVLVVKAQIPSDGSSFTRNWCEDYKALCYNYGYRPTGCGVDYADDSNYASCRYDYQSVMPADNVYGCPAVGTIALVANAAGFSNATVGNSFGFSDCNATCVSTLTNGGPFIDLSVTDGIVYTICETSDSNFKVMSTVQSVYKGGEYTFVQAQVPQDLISKHDTWCTDYQRMCESFGLKPVARSQLETKDEYVTCRKKYGAINTKLNEATTSSEIQTFGGPFLRYSRLDDNRNLFVFGQKCDDYCFKDLKDGYYEYALEDIYVSYLYRYDYTVSTVCASSDSNFRVISTKTIAHQGQDFLVIMAKLPEHRMSKYENWCRDYERLCRSFRKRPTGCGLSYQWSSKHRACVDKYQSAMAMNDPVGCNSSETVASIANLAGYKFAHMNNSFAFYQCSSECPQKLSSSCSDSLPCLNDRSDIVYTVCTDSSSAFEVERVVHTNEGNTPLLFIVATLNGVVDAKSGDWCEDYQRLCQSYAARPVGCYSSKTNDDLTKCETKYNAVPLQSDVQRCGGDGKNDIDRLRGLTPDLTDGAYFKCHKCKEGDCKKSLSQDCHAALNCLKKSDWVYTTCSRASHNFDIINTKTTSHGELSDILVVKASVPADGRSLYDSWCEDYTKLCSTYDRVPLACPLRPDYTAESAYRACNKEYKGYMMRNYELEGNATLSCPLNKLISDIAKKATFNQVSPTNTLGLNTCLSCSKTLQVVNDGAYLSMSCLPGATCTPWNTTLDRKVFLLCVKPPQVNSTFHIDEVRFVKHRDRKYASVRVSMPNGEESIHNDWCTDYQKICESLSMRPIAGGRSYERLMGRRKCRIKYNAVMLEEFGLPNYDLIADISRAAGFNYNEDMVFSLNDCNSCSRKIFTSEGVDKITSTSSFQYTTACTYSDSNFEELQRRNVTVDGKSYLVVKAQLPADMVSSHKTWCKDYQMMCESYGKRPLTCVEGTDFQTNYNSLFLTHSCDSSIPKQAGFADATDENTLMFKSYNGAKCSRKLPSADGPFGRLNSNVPHRLVYALCLNSATAFEVLAKKWHDEQSSTYLFLQVAMPENGIANYNTWCHDYRELCREYGMRPVSCSEYYCRTQHGALRKLDDVCPLDKMVSLAEKAQITEVKSTTSFLYSFICNTNNCKKVVETRNCTARGKKIPLCFDRDENNGEFTTVCSWPKEQTRFSTLDVKYVRYLGRPYTVIRTRKTSRVSLQNNWCNDYKHLCRSFMQRPLACPARYNTDAEHHLCQRNYEGVSMETDDHECPMNKFVAELAQYAGFSRATPQNSFAFRNCKDAFCKNQLPTGECSEALYCVNMLGDQEDLYTACVSGDSAFNVRRYKFNVNYNYDNYGVIKVTISEGLKSAHEDWCKDYQRLCESWNMEAVQCATGLELASDICSINYGAHQRLSSCAADAKAIATKAQLGSVADKTALVMDGCKYCSNIVTKTCSSSLNCLRSGTLFAVCAMQKQVDAFKPVQTRFVNYGNTAYLLIQSYLHSRQSHSFMNAYNNLCEQIYGYQPILCGRDAVDGSSSYRSCRDSYPNALSHQGNDFICPPAKTIAFIAQRFGFHRALHSSSFAFYQCSHYYYYRWSYGYQLSTSSCNNRVWCLMWNQYYMLHYTMCAVPKLSPSLGFHVLDKKELIFLGIKYVAFKLSLGTSGVSATDNWCYDYRELCRKYNMVPTGCGTSKKKESGYLQCSSKYRSFMSHRNAVGCGKNPAPSSLARRAGFPDASEQNTFVFNDCSKCAKNLPPTSCDSALTCLYSEVFNKHAYTLCVERKSGFEYVAKKTTIYGGVEYSVVKSALPVDNRPLYDNWCVDYQKLCYSVGAFPVACSLASGVQDLRRFAEKYGAITVESIPCPPIAKVLAIVQKAGYSNAVSGNSFVFTGQSSAECSKDLPTAHCTPGLDCLNQQFREVYAVCTNPTNFAVSDVRTSWHSGNTFTVVEATLPTSGLSKTSSWCEDYATLCRSMKQQPVVCAGHADSKQYEKCRDNYHGYLLFDKYDCNTEKRLLYQIAQFAGFAKGNFGNTIGFASCASCTRELHVGPECDSSLNCVNNQTADRLAYAVCLRESEHSGFQVVETKDTATSEVEYKVVKALASPFGKSKYDTWCKDYERMCSSLEMRPIRCSSADGSTCPLLHKALVSSQENFDCEDNAGLLKFVKSVGYSEATQNNTFIFGACSTAEKCRKTLLDNSCDGSMNCLKKQPGSRLIFTLCARGRHTSFRYLDSSVHVHQGIHFLVIKASKFSDESKSINWCYDYRNMCVSFGRQPIVFGSFGQHFNNDRNQCFAAYNATSTMVNINSYQTILSEMSIPVSNCRVVYMYCKNCIKTFQHCPFRACNCDLFYLFCL